MQIQAPALRNAESSWQRELCAVAALQAFPWATTGLAGAREREQVLLQALVLRDHLRGRGC